MKPTIGRIVLYVLSATDAESINALRGDELTPQRGNRAIEGQIMPAMVVNVFGDYENPPINLKVQLDGTDTHWATSRHMSDEKTPGTWHWMEYQKQVAAANSVGGMTLESAGKIMARGLESGATAQGLVVDGVQVIDPIVLADAEGKPLDVTPEQTPEELEKLKAETGF